MPGSTIPNIRFNRSVAVAGTVAKHTGRDRAAAAQAWHYRGRKSWVTVTSRICRLLGSKARIFT
jgi:hypothetical protein